MGSETKKKQILDLFEKNLLKNYHQFCELHKVQEDCKSLITYLIDEDLIRPGDIQKYTIIKEYDNYEIQNRGQKTQTVMNLAARFKVSTRTIWSIIKSK